MKRTQNSIFSTRNLVLMAALIALQIVTARYLSIQTPTLRLSFETIPLALAGMWLGPLGGAIVALVSDILGTIVSGYGVWFAPITLGPVLFAAMCGWSTRYIFRSSLAETRDAWKVIVTTVVAGAVNAFLIGTLTVTLYNVIFTDAQYTFVDLMKAFFDGTIFDLLAHSIESGKFTALLAANFGERLATKPVVVAACALLTALIHRTVYRPVIARIVNRAKK